MFAKILIANRGEIACRIIRTARRLGIRSVAVHSEADRHAQHVTLADEAVFIGASPAAESYLVGARIIEAALASGAEAIHPGYGFLSENPEFVDQVEQAGLTFIGPKAHSIRAMGLKDAAKRLMEAAGVPVVPGYHGEVQEAAFLKDQAEGIGYPVLIKASAGGGGKGMRRVDHASDFDAALESCRREARASFGEDRVLIEKYVLSPRHIEVQVFGDAHGNVVHLFERDCSLQRRHQKVIEEAPAPGMTAEVRAAMTSAAVRAARAVDYQGAGTIEFIADGTGALRPDGFWFMEMNTRLQVEHPVTEAITGFDLVEWQLRVASGLPLPAVQEAISTRGHAVEARLYAEDPANGFLPQAGHIDHLVFGGGEGVRIDGGVTAGDRVSPFYDPMIAKVIAHGETRVEAIDRLMRALDETLISGLATNRDFLRALCRDETFRDGAMDTALIDRKLDGLVRKPAFSETAFACAAIAIHGIEPGARHSGFRLWGAAEHRTVLHHDGEAFERRLSVERGLVTLAGGSETVRITDIEWKDSATAPDTTEMTGRLHGPAATVRCETRVCCSIHAGTRRAAVLIDGETHVFERPDPSGDSEGVHGSIDDIVAPMTGMVRLVQVKAGDVVKVGDRLAILEAMKMEHTLKAPRDGEIGEVFCTEGGQVEGGAVLVRLS